MLDELAQAIRRHPTDIWSTTAAPRLSLIAADDAMPPTDLLYEPMICFVATGSKRVDVGTRHLIAARGEMMFNSLAVPIIATLREVPYRSVVLHLDATRLTDLMLELGEDESAPGPDPGGQLIAPMSQSLIAAVTRWVQLLDTPDDIPVLAHRTEAEILYRLVRSPLGPALRQFAAAGSAQARIRLAAAWICEHYNEPLRVEAIAAIAHMSVATLHRQFRAATGMSPIRFQKQVWLQRARVLLVSGDANAVEVAHAVGYSTPTQFSREYRRAYGAPPLQDASRLRNQWHANRPVIAAN